MSAATTEGWWISWVNSLLPVEELERLARVEGRVVSGYEDLADGSVLYTLLCARGLVKVLKKQPSQLYTLLDALKLQRLSANIAVRGGKYLLPLSNVPDMLEETSRVLTEKQAQSRGQKRSQRSVRLQKYPKRATSASDASTPARRTVQRARKRPLVVGTMVDPDYRPRKRGVAAQSSMPARKLRAAAPQASANDSWTIEEEKENARRRLESIRAEVKSMESTLMERKVVERALAQYSESIESGTVVDAADVQRGNDDMRRHMRRSTAAIRKLMEKVDDARSAAEKLQTSFQNAKHGHVVNGIDALKNILRKTNAATKREFLQLRIAMESIARFPESQESPVKEIAADTKLLKDQFEAQRAMLESIQGALNAEATVLSSSADNALLPLILPESRVNTTPVVEKGIDSDSDAKGGTDSILDYISELQRQVVSEE